MSFPVYVLGLGAKSVAFRNWGMFLEAFSVAISYNFYCITDHFLGHFNAIKLMPRAIHPNDCIADS